MSGSERAEQAAKVRQVFLVSFVVMGIGAAAAAMFDQLLLAAVLGAGAMTDLICMWLFGRSS